jgi:hypothetical protein
MPLSCLLSCFAAVLARVGSLEPRRDAPSAPRYQLEGTCGPYRLGRTAARAGTWASTRAREPVIAGGPAGPLFDRHPHWLGLKNGSRPATHSAGTFPRPERGAWNARAENATPARRFPARSSRRRYGDRAVVVPRDAVARQEHPAALRRPNPPGLAPVGPHDSAVIARSEGRRPQAVITRSSLEHPAAIHVAVGTSPAGGTEQVVSPRTHATGLISRPDSSDPAFVWDGDLPSCGIAMASHTLTGPDVSRPPPPALGPRVAHFRRQRNPLANEPSDVAGAGELLIPAHEGGGLTVGPLASYA